MVAITGLVAQAASLLNARSRSLLAEMGRRLHNQCRQPRLRSATMLNGVFPPWQCEALNPTNRTNKAFSQVWNSEFRAGRRDRRLRRRRGQALRRSSGVQPAHRLLSLAVPGPFLKH